MLACVTSWVVTRGAVCETSGMRTPLFAFALVLLACGDDGAGGSGGEAATSGTTASTATRASSTSPSSSSTGAQPSCDDVTCGGDEFCYAGVCRACGAPEGDLHDQVLALGDGEEDRFYFMHVPAAYDCGPTPLLVDFHGTSSGDEPEVSYQNDALVALGEAHGAIVVRPRSRSSLEGGQQIYRWDQNPGDIDRNVLFTQNLVEKLRATYNVDPDRLYAAGFSSGSNMTAQFLGDARGLFRGLAPIAGGLFGSGIVAFDDFDPGTAPRLYLATGYRDYLFPTVRTLLGALDDVSYPTEAILLRESDTGHDLYAWHFEEIWAWLDEGTLPATGSPDAPWQAEVAPTSDSFVASSRGPGGEIFAGTSTGEVLRRDTAGTWSTFGQVGDGDAGITGLCASSTGRLFTVGEGAFARSDALGVFEPPRTVPEFDGAFFGTAYLNGIGCAGDALAAGGYWSSARSEDAGGTFSQLSMLYGGGIPAQASAVWVTEAGTRIGVGYFDYVGRAAAAATAYDEIAHPPGAEWLNDVTSIGTHVFVVGDHGMILHSADDGATFEEQASPTVEDLYAISFFDPDHGVAAGRRGTVVVTSDGGATWTLLPTGVDVYFGAAHMLDADTALVLGEGGRAFRVTVP